MAENTLWIALAGLNEPYIFCGPSLPVINPATGEVRRAAIFIATLCASNYTCRGL